MISDNKLKNLLRTVILESDAKEIAEYEAEAAEVTFTPEYYERKNMILGESKKRERTYNRKRTLKRALLAACILTLCFFALGMTSKPFREAFRNMFVNVFDEYFQTGFVPEPPKDVDEPMDTEIPTYMKEYYAPSVIPDWVTSQRSARIKEYERIYYLQDKKISATFFQRLLSAKPVLNADEYELSTVEINGNAGELGISTDGEKLILIWDDGRYSYEINGNLDKDTAVSMAESLTRTYDWPTVLLEFYAPEYVPDGYTTTVEAKDFGGVSVTYWHDNGNFITFDQSVLNTDVKIDSTDVETYGVTVNGREATILEYLDNDITTLLWNDGRYSYYLIGNSTAETLIKMAESLKPF